MDWAALEAHLETLGRADTDGVRRRARYTRHRCGAPVLTGLDADVAGLPVACDVVDLDPASEAAWLVLAGLRTYTVHEYATGLQLNPRDPLRIGGVRQDRPVVGMHECGRAPPPSTAWRWRPPTPLPPDTLPPF